MAKSKRKGRDSAKVAALKEALRYFIQKSDRLARFELMQPGHCSRDFAAEDLEDGYKKLLG